MTIRVTMIIEDGDSYPKPPNGVPTMLRFVSEMSSGDNPRFFADTVQRAVAKAAREVHDYMEKSIDLKQEPIRVKPYMPGRADV